jgi:hypothetical protein
MTIHKLLKEHHIVIPQDKLDYYYDKIRKNDLQEYILANFFAKDLGSTEIIHFCDRRQYIILLIILKDILCNNGFTILPQLIVGSVNNINEKSTLGKKVLLDIINDPRFVSIQSDKYSFIKNEDDHDISKNNMIVRLEANILNNKFTYNDYEDQTHDDDIIVIDNDLMLRKEVLDLVDLI